MTLWCKNLSKSFDGQAVLENVNLSVGEGEFLAVLGRSGCGKTTLLRLLGGFLAPDSGEVRLGERRVTGPGKDAWMVFQDFRQLFPWMTLAGNLLFALKRARPELSKAEARALARRCLDQMELLDAGDKYPRELSGGMAQRGAFARALALSPKVLLLDEPFSSLDIRSRENAANALLKLQDLTGAAAVFVTHDIAEASALAPRIAVMTPESRGIQEILQNNGPDTVPALSRLLMDSPDTR
ncbi:MAG TPA: ABC transporter ATP-binding protein [Clostridia bacterium]|nr:ABC transporter ATP-binding protein [Clostridia bacterium]